MNDWMKREREREREREGNKECEEWNKERNEFLIENKKRKIRKKGINKQEREEEKKKGIEERYFVNEWKLIFWKWKRGKKKMIKKQECLVWVIWY